MATSIAQSTTSCMNNNNNQTTTITAALASESASNSTTSNSPTPSLDSLPRANSIGSFSGEPSSSASCSSIQSTTSSLDNYTLSSSAGSAATTGQLNTLKNLLNQQNNQLLLGEQPIDLFNSKVLNRCVQCCDIVLEQSRLISCFHTVCQSCLEKAQLACPRCQADNLEVILSNLLCEEPTHPSINSVPAQQQPIITGHRCTGCKTQKLDAVARCIDCVNTLCSNCVMAHQFMHCFEGHRVQNLPAVTADLKGISDVIIDNSKLDQHPSSNSPKSSSPPPPMLPPSLSNTNTNINPSTICPRHKVDPLKYYCRTCMVPVCKECIVADHPAGMHEYEHLADAAQKQMEGIVTVMQEAKAKASDVRNVLKSVEHVSSKLQVQYHKAQNEINDTFAFYRSMLEERKQELLKELESVFSAKQISLGVATQKGQETIDSIYKTCEFVDKVNKCATVVEIMMLRKLIDSKLRDLLNYSIDQSVQSACELEFVSNYQAIQVGVRNTFGYVRNSEQPTSSMTKQPPIARPTTTNGQQSNGGSSSSGSSVNGSSGSLNGGIHGCQPFSVSSSSQSTSPFESNIISKRFSSANSLGPFGSSCMGGANGADHMINGLNGMNNSSANIITNLTQPSPYEKWSNGGGADNNSIFHQSNGGNNGDPYGGLSSVNGDSMLDLTSKLMSTTIFPPKSQIKRQKMIYHCKFGEFGVMEGQFTEPSGVAVNAQNDIIVADTNNHRIQIFDKEGRFKFQFGECGKRDGQLLYPNRVAVVRTSGDIIVTERSPTHQIQIYNQYGQFVRKFGANILQHPRGVTVDCKGRIVVVECKVMRVIIFDQQGGVLQKFGCSKHLEFPNGVVVNDKQEIFISDNRAHCVKVFSYEGVYLRQIGGEGITNYPIGVGINAAGEILIADNHNNFNLTIFTQDGQLVSALESKVKHAQCFDVALMDDGSVVLASKDYRLYIYRYVQVPPIGL